jgi:hypothetical protein
MPVRDKVFRTQLKLIGGNLVDTNETDDPSDDVTFMRLSDEAEMVDEARSAVETLVKPLDRGEVDQFYTTAASSSFRANTTLDQFHSAMTEMQTKGGLVNSRRYLQTTNILYAPMITKTKGEYVLFSNTVGTTKKTGGVEFILLIREQSEWKVYWINYGS